MGRIEVVQHLGEHFNCFIWLTIRFFRGMNSHPAAVGQRTQNYYAARDNEMQLCEYPIFTQKSIASLAQGVSMFPLLQTQITSAQNSTSAGE